MPEIRGFSVISWHDNPAKQESGFLCGFTAAIALHIPHYRAFGIGGSQERGELKAQKQKAKSAKSGEHVPQIRVRKIRESAANAVGYSRRMLDKVSTTRPCFS